MASEVKMFAYSLVDANLIYFLPSLWGEQNTVTQRENKSRPYVILRRINSDEITVI